MHDSTITSERTLCFLVKANNILLSKKLVRLGAGKYNGFGGGVEPGEPITKAALREVEEECLAYGRESDLDKRAIIEFYFPHEPHNNQRVHVFFLTDWEGVPSATDEMDEPESFPLDNIPYDQMWASDKEWLPYLVEGKKIKATFVWNPDRTVKDRKIDVVEKLE